jgi:hydrogenase maturation protease
MRKLLVIGYGNPLRRDDGIGWHIAQELLRSRQLPNVETIARIQLTPELAEPISRANVVLFIDASRECPAGQIRQGRILPQETKPALNHHVTAEALLQLADDVYYAKPEAYVFSVGVESFAYGTEPSPALAAAYPSLVARVREFIHCHVKVSA